MSLRFSTRVWGIRKNDVSADPNSERLPVSDSPTQASQSGLPKPERQMNARAKGGTTNATPTLRETVLNFINSQKLTQKTNLKDSTDEQVLCKDCIYWQPMIDTIYMQFGKCTNPRVAMFAKDYNFVPSATFSCNWAIKRK